MPRTIPYRSISQSKPLTHSHNTTLRAWFVCSVFVSLLWFVHAVLQYDNILYCPLARFYSVLTDGGRVALEVYCTWCTPVRRPGVGCRSSGLGTPRRAYTPVRGARCGGLPQGAVSGISEISRRAQSPEIWASSDLAVSSLLRDRGELIQPGVHQQQHALHLLRVRVGVRIRVGVR